MLVAPIADKIIKSFVFPEKILIIPIPNPTKSALRGVL
jgi:hypothetical protein